MVYIFPRMLFFRFFFKFWQPFILGDGRSVLSVLHFYAFQAAAIYIEEIETVKWKRMEGDRDYEYHFIT